MGKNKYIETPRKLWELYVGYKKETKSNPILKHVFVGKDGQSTYEQREKPLTMVGFENYVCEHTEITYPDLKQYFENRDDAYSNYSPISSRIKADIKRDQIEGGMAMVYSQSITARLNGLSETTKTEISGGFNIPEVKDIGNR